MVTGLFIYTIWVSLRRRYRLDPAVGMNHGAGAIAIRHDNRLAATGRGRCLVSRAATGRDGWSARRLDDLSTWTTGRRRHRRRGIAGQWRRWGWGGPSGAGVEIGPGGGNAP